MKVSELMVGMIVNYAGTPVMVERISKVEFGEYSINFGGVLGAQKFHGDIEFQTLPPKPGKSILELPVKILEYDHRFGVYINMQPDDPSKGFTHVFGNYEDKIQAEYALEDFNVLIHAIVFGGVTKETAEKATSMMFSFCVLDSLEKLGLIARDRDRYWEVMI